MKSQLRWRVWLTAGFGIVIAFTWLNEIIDLPHFLLGAPATPVNWKESLIETGFTLIAFLISCGLVSYYEKQWMSVTSELNRRATTDDLTGVLNRRQFLGQAEEEFQRSKRFGRKLTLALFDLDKFKSINDRHGHLTGDKVLQELAKAVSNNVRQQDFIGRLGGDEFGIIFIETSKKDAHQIAARILKQWNETALMSDEGRTVTVSFSMGISSIHTRDQSITDCIRRADKALYNAKRKGRNRVELA
ncbi:MAG: GGDEF domain-containing protein [Chloroflexi bacterium]|nr:GGDEF domain-containing protein [Chloroflexota bacterium]